jgi:hypothetical protein
MALRELRRPYNAQDEINATTPLYHDAPWPAELEMETITYCRPCQLENIPLSRRYHSRTITGVLEPYLNITLIHGQTENQIYQLNVGEGTVQRIESSERNNMAVRRALDRQARINEERYMNQLGQIYPMEEVIGLVQRFEYRRIGLENGEMETQHRVRLQALIWRIRMPESGRVMRYENGARIRDPNVYRQADWSHAEDWDGYVGNERPVLERDEPEPQEDWEFEDGDGEGIFRVYYGN